MQPGDQESFSFNQGSEVWIKDDTTVWAAAVVDASPADSNSTVSVRSKSGKVIQVPNSASAILPKNPPDAVKGPNLIKHEFLHEASMLESLHARFQEDDIYTFSGPVLISVNPYASLPIYGDESIASFRNISQDDDTNPHVYCIAQRAYSRLVQERQSQSIIITGESGAGKTEATKYMLRYLAAVATDDSKLTLGTSMNPLMRATRVEQQVVDSSPIMEAFGNAKTVRNDNSSRFGKFMELHFSPEGRIQGAKIQNYMLEQSRIIGCAASERLYHVFYMLVQGCNEDEKNKYQLLSKASEYEFLKSGDLTIEGKDDQADFTELKAALGTCGMSGVEGDLFSIVSAVMLLGNIVFRDGANDSSNVANSEVVNQVADLLRVSSTTLGTNLTSRSVSVGRDKVVRNQTAKQAVFLREALAKSLYSKLFDYIVGKINETVNRQESKLFVGLLDIFGFESFKVNSFEQLSINYTNEKLQQFFNMHMFQLEVQEYETEGVPVTSISINDNTEAVRLFEGKGGLLDMLDEECFVPQANDKTYAEKVCQKYQKHDFFEKPRLAQKAFVVKHYAGDVQYTTDGFLEKNQDPLSEDLMELMQSSGSNFLSALFTEPGQAGSASAQGGTKKKRRTVAGQFKASLISLTDRLAATHTHYVRTIKPNAQKKAKDIDFPMVLRQLLCSGVLEVMRIRVAGFPVRRTFEQFTDRFWVLDPDGSRTGGIDACRALLAKSGIPAESFTFGKSKVFLKDRPYSAIEAQRTIARSRAASLLQSAVQRVRSQAYLRGVLSSTIAAQSLARRAAARHSFVAMFVMQVTSSRFIRQTLARQNVAICVRLFMSLAHVFVRRGPHVKYCSLLSRGLDEKKAAEEAAKEAERQAELKERESVAALERKLSRRVESMKLGNNLPTPASMKLTGKVLACAKTFGVDLAEVPSSAPRMVGNLTKQGGSFKSWNSRWFELRGERLYYFKNKKDASVGVEKAKGDVPLHGATVENGDQDSGKKFCLKIVTSGRTYFVAAQSQDDKQSWAQTLLQCIQYHLNESGQWAVPENVVEYPSKSGWLHKRGSSKSNWQKRWFTLKDCELFYYQTQNASFPLGAIPLDQSTFGLAGLGESGRRNSLEVNAPHKSYFLACADDVDADSWLKAMKESKALCEENKGSEDALGEAVASSTSGGKDEHLEGYLFKRGGKKSQAWKRRFFKLSNGAMSYFKNHKDSHAAGGIPLTNFTVARTDSVIGIPNSFEIFTPFRTYSLKSDSTDDMMRWVGALRKFQSRSAESENSLSLSKSGYLEEKARAGGGNVWSRKWFAIRAGVMYYYKNQESGYPLGEIRLSSASLGEEAIRQSDRQFCFELDLGRGGLILAAASQEEVEAWKSVLQRLCSEKESGSEEQESSASAHAATAGGGQIQINADKGTVIGILQKASGSHHRWQQRHFVLDGLQLSYYKRADDALAAGRISLEDCAISNGDSKDHPFSLELITPAKKYYLAAETSKEMSAWQSAMMKNQVDLLGTAFFVVEQSDFQRFPRRVVLRVDDSGLALLQYGGHNVTGKEVKQDEQRKLLATFDFASDILSWNSTASSFEFVSIPLKKSLSFATLQGPAVMQSVQAAAQRAYDKLMAANNDD